MSFDHGFEMDDAIAIEIKGLSKVYRSYRRPVDRLKQAIFRDKIYYREFDALTDVSFEIRRGETVGIIGRNGSGKSTLLQLIVGTLTSTGGSAQTNGRIAALLELGSGFNPEFTGRENVYVNAALIGLTHKETDARMDEIIAFSELDEFIDEPVWTYSSGMTLRLAFSVAISVDPDILIVDEALSVGDEAFQRKCFAQIEALQSRGGTILFVSHSANSITHLCSRAILLDHGELLLDGRPKMVVSQYHRMLYAPEDRVQALRTEIRAMKDSTRLTVDEAPQVSLTTDNDRKTEVAKTGPPFVGRRQHAFYDPGFKPKSRADYDTRGAQIEDPRIETLDGERVNVLCLGDTYIYTFRVRFIEPAFGVRFGMFFRTVKGVELGGSGSAGALDVIEHLEAGSVATVRFRFTCILLPGTYFLNAGVSGLIDGGRQFLHRILDAAILRVLPESDLLAAGNIDFAIEADVSYDSP